MSVGAVNKQTGDRIPTAGMPAIDNALSAISTNPVQNAIITAALAGKQNTLTIDSVPTDGSSNPVESNGVYDALATKQDATDNNLETTSKTVVGAVNELKSGLTNLTDAVGWSGHNYLVNDGQTEEKNGVTFTLNSDGTWTVDGTATEDTVKTISLQKNFTFAGGKLLSGCPSISGLSLRLAKNTSPYTQYAIDRGNGVTIPAQTMDQTVAIIVVENGTHVDNAVVKPMISDGVIPYVQYHPVIGPAVEDLQSGLDDVKTGKINCINITAGNKTTYSFTFDHSGNDVYAFVFGKFGTSATKFSIAVISHPNDSEALCMSLGDDTITVACSGHTVTVTGPSNYARVTIISSAGIVN